MFKLKNISENQKSNFKVQDLGTCRFYYVLDFDDNNYTVLSKYLISTGKRLSDKDTQFITDKNYLFACFDTKKLYKIDAIGNLYIFDIKKYEQDKKNLIINEMPENPIPINVIIETKNKSVIEMMQKRGCKILPNKNSYFITSDNLKYNKKFLNNLEIKSVKDIAKTEISSRTGIEKFITIEIKDTLTKKTTKCKGIFVSSIKENKAFVGFNYDGINTYYEIWYDISIDPKTNQSTVKILNDWQKENQNKLKGKKFQSNRIYIWNI